MVVAKPLALASFGACKFFSRCACSPSACAWAFSALLYAALASMLGIANVSVGMFILLLL